jgi:hypothetical protein
MTFRGMLLAAAFAGVTGASLSAATITGSFNIAGTMIVTQNAIDWQSNDMPFPAMKATIGPGATGSFAALSGTTITIEDLNRTTEPVGSSFGPDFFISFDAAPTMPSLDISMIFAGIYGTSQCGPPPAVGQTCTPGPPITPTASPFNFVNNPPAPGQATATFAFAGNVAGTTSTWTGNFTSQFTEPLQQVLSDFQSTGQISNTYSASINVVAGSATPETSTLSMFGLGLGLILFARSNGLIARMRRQ